MEIRHGLYADRDGIVVSQEGKVSARSSCPDGERSSQPGHATLPTNLIHPFCNVWADVIPATTTAVAAKVVVLLIASRLVIVSSMYY